MPPAWKKDNITPIPQEKPVREINKHLRPISLTSTISKLAEKFVVEQYVAPAILKVVDPAQFGGIPRSSATYALISMVHTWTEATDASGNTVMGSFVRLPKVFDLIDHRILAGKINTLSIPSFIKMWILDFLTDRVQRVKLSYDCFSERAGVPSGVPQGTKLGPWLFILMINDLRVSNVDIDHWKYIDDTSISEIVGRDSATTIQNAVDGVQTWYTENELQFNTSKCKQLRFPFSKSKNSSLPNVTLGSSSLEVVNHAQV